MNGLISKLFLLSILLVSCIEPYRFDVKSREPSLVVEGHISDVSYNESLDYPSDGRFFTVILRYTSDVNNVRGQVVENASVVLVSNSGDSWTYTPSELEPGKYILADRDFKARKDTMYKLQISLADGKSYESAWEQLPSAAPGTIGNVDFEEIEKQVYVVKAGEQEVETIKGINVRMDLPEREPGNPVYYLWDFEPTWIYVAPLARPSNPVYRCWVTGKHYITNYTLQIDNVGGYKKDLFFIETEINERVTEGLSVLVKQYAMTEGFYFFWKEMKDQAEGGFIQDTPPFNLQTNFKALDSDERVAGYFGVVDEEAIRWYFSVRDLSYPVHNSMKYLCENPPGPPVRGEPNSCENCLAYDKGPITNVQPSWWDNK